MSWVEKIWYCDCGAMNAGWLDKCGKCNKEKINLNKNKNYDKTRNFQSDS